jgi:hypothetical protein
MVLIRTCIQYTPYISNTDTSSELCIRNSSVLFDVELTWACKK